MILKGNLFVQPLKFYLHSLPSLSVHLASDNWIQLNPETTVPDLLRWGINWVPSFIFSCVTAFILGCFVICQCTIWRSGHWICPVNSQFVRLKGLYIAVTGQHIACPRPFRMAPWHALWSSAGRTKQMTVFKMINECTFVCHLFCSCSGLLMKNSLLAHSGIFTISAWTHCVFTLN